MDPSGFTGHTSIKNLISPLFFCRLFISRERERTGEEREERERREKKRRERGDGTAAPIALVQHIDEKREEERRREKRRRADSTAQHSTAQRDGSSQGVSGGRRAAHKHKRTGSPSREENKR